MSDQIQASENRARSVFERLQEATLTRNPQIAELFAADGVIEWPFARPGAPTRIIGLPAIRSLYTAWFQAPPLEYQAFTGTVVHETADPEFIVVEYDIQGVTTSSRTPFRLGVIRTLRVHDGHIVLLREYMNPLALTEALNR
jgi:ketosteroid isomerase-like protein